MMTFTAKKQTEMILVHLVLLVVFLISSPMALATPADATSGRETSQAPKTPTSSTEIQNSTEKMQSDHKKSPDVDDEDPAADEDDEEEEESIITEELKPPKPEPPYPGSDVEEGFGQPTQNAQQSKKQKAKKPQEPLVNNQEIFPVELNPEPLPKNAKTPTAPAPLPTETTQSFTPPPEPPPVRLERPLTITEDGVYIYSTDNKPPPVSSRTYERPPLAPESTKTMPLEKPIAINESGMYQYARERIPHTRSASARFGLFSPPAITNPRNSKEFSDIYKDPSIPTFFFDYEWRLSRKMGDVGLKFGSGIFVARGRGQFAVDDPERLGKFPDEKYTFFMMPNTGTGVYRFRYRDDQFFVPYVEAGLGYFTFVEVRDDGRRTKGGAAPVAIGAGGLNFLLDNIDRHAMNQLQNDYGISHAYFSVEFKLVLGIHPDYDFTSAVANGGFVLEF